RVQREKTTEGVVDVDDLATGIRQYHTECQIVHQRRKQRCLRRFRARPGVRRGARTYKRHRSPKGARQARMQKWRASKKRVTHSGRSRNEECLTIFTNFR